LRSGALGGSWLGGVEEFWELRFRRRLSSANFLALLGDLLGQLLDLLVHPQQDGDDRLPALVVDRFGLGALHAKRFAGRRLCPPTPTERLLEQADLQGILVLG
jgi:hypothetical protein